MFKKLILQFLIAGIGLGLRIKLLPGVQFNGSWEVFLTCVSTLALINFLIKPFLKKFFFPVRLLTLGLFNIIINAGILLVIDYLFDELTIAGFVPLLNTSLIISALNFIFNLSN